MEWPKIPKTLAKILFTTINFRLLNKNTIKILTNNNHNIILIYKRNSKNKIKIMKLTNKNLINLLRMIQSKVRIMNKLNNRLMNRYKKKFNKGSKNYQIKSKILNMNKMYKIK